MNLYETDYDFISRFEHFAFDEVIHEEGQQLESRTRYIAIIATLIGCQGMDAFKEILPKALDGGVTPVEIKEIIYQATDYLGYGRMLPFCFRLMNYLNSAVFRFLLKVSQPQPMKTDLKRVLKHRQKSLVIS